MESKFTQLSDLKLSPVSERACLFELRQQSFTRGNCLRIPSRRCKECAHVQQDIIDQRNPGVPSQEILEERNRIVVFPLLRQEIGSRALCKGSGRQ